MKKLKSIILLIIIIMCTTACEDKTTDLNIATTIYPIYYLTSELFPEGNIISIYPDGADTSSYTLTEKRIKEYSKNDAFIYNGLSNEQTIAKDLINSNKNLYIIDVAYGLNVSYSVEELWLSPNYFLMVAMNIRDNLEELTNSKYLNEEIEKRYDSLEETLSIMDADLREIADDAKSTNRNTLVVSSNKFKYLENYGFNVIVLSEEENTSSIKSNFKNNTYTTIFMGSKEEKTDLITDLETNYNAKIVSVNTMETLEKEEKDNKETYLTIMEDFIEDIRKVTLGE